MRRVLCALSALLVAGVAGYFGLGAVLVLLITTPRARRVGASPEGFGLGGCREVGFESEDGLPLRAWWMPTVDEDRRAAVLVHGHGGNRSEGHVLATARTYRRAGFAVLVPDLRAHGSSGGDRQTLGYAEPRDVLATLRWLGKRGYDPERAVLHGWSMGGASIVRAAPGTGISAAVEEAGFADLPLLMRWMAPAMALFARSFLGFDPKAVRPRKDVARLREEGVPILIIHSTTDRIVPYEHALLLKRAYPEAELWTLRGVAHVGAYGHPGYEERLLRFLDGIPRPKRR